jgi:mRNA interferase MazF
MSEPKSSKTDRYCPDAGDLIWVDLDPIKGHEQAGRRPAVVLTARPYNAASGLCVVCPITRRVRGYPFEVAMPDGFGAVGAVLADQIRSLSWENRRIKFINRIPASPLLADVRERIAALLGIE